MFKEGNGDPCLRVVDKIPIIAIQPEDGMVIHHSEYYESDNYN